MQGNSLLLTICPSLSHQDWHLPFASLLLFFLVDRMEWQRLSALWDQYWTQGNTKTKGSSRNLFLCALTFRL
jgi:hypothetical protein